MKTNFNRWQQFWFLLSAILLLYVCFYSYKVLRNEFSVMHYREISEKMLSWHFTPKEAALYFATDQNNRGPISAEMIALEVAVRNAIGGHPLSQAQEDLEKLTDPKEMLAAYHEATHGNPSLSELSPIQIVATVYFSTTVEELVRATQIKINSDLYSSLRTQAKTAGIIIWLKEVGPLFAIWFVIITVLYTLGFTVGWTLNLVKKYLRRQDNGL